MTQLSWCLNGLQKKNSPFSILGPCIKRLLQIDPSVPDDNLFATNRAVYFQNTAISSSFHFKYPFRRDNHSSVWSGTNSHTLQLLLKFIDFLLHDFNPAGILPLLCMFEVSTIREDDSVELVSEGENGLVNVSLSNITTSIFGSTFIELSREFVVSIFGEVLGDKSYFVYKVYEKKKKNGAPGCMWR
ncbi:hypothetical protein Tco_0742073 [Tanacetum coccineum]